MIKKIVVLFFIFTSLTILKAYTQSDKLTNQFDYYRDNDKFRVKDGRIYLYKIFENVNGNETNITLKLQKFLSKLSQSQNKFLLNKNNKESGIYGEGVCDSLINWYNIFNGEKQLNARYFFNIDPNIDEHKILIIIASSKWNLIDLKIKRGKPEIEIKDDNILDYAPFTDKKFVDKEKQTQAFLILIDRFHQIITDFEEILYEDNE